MYEKRTDTTRCAGVGAVNRWRCLRARGVGGGAILSFVRASVARRPPARQSCTRAAWSRSLVLCPVVFRATPIVVVRPSQFRGFSSDSSDRGYSNFPVAVRKNRRQSRASRTRADQRYTLSPAMWRTALLAAVVISLAFDRCPPVAQGSNTFIDEETNLSSDCEYRFLSFI